MHGKFNRTELITLPTITLYLFLFDVFALLKFGATVELIAIGTESAPKIIKCKKLNSLKHLVRTTVAESHN